MKQSTKASALMHKLLIENEMDDFSVIEARDAFLLITEETNDPAEARKKVYRQILRFESNGWLRSEGSGRNKKYFQTGLLKTDSFLKDSNQELDTETRQLIPDYSVLISERNEYTGELEITLNEIDECHALISRFPSLEKELAPFLKQSKARSTSLLGKVNVLSHVINVLFKDTSLC